MSDRQRGPLAVGDDPSCDNAHVHPEPDERFAFPARAIPGKADVLAMLIPRGSAKDLREIYSEIRVYPGLMLVRPRGAGGADVPADLVPPQRGYYAICDVSVHRGSWECVCLGWLSPEGAEAYRRRDCNY